MKLYHGTTERTWRKIEKAGRLAPRGRRPSVWEVASNPNAVYLTNSYALHFARNACGWHVDENVAIIEIDAERLQPLLFAPDEDFLEQASRGNESFPVELLEKPMAERTLYFRKRAHKEYRSFWITSLEKLGNCCYFGPIEREAITRVAILPVGHELAMASDPSITLTNYRLLGAYYRNLTRAVFGDLGQFEPDHLLQRSNGLDKVDRSAVKVLCL